MSGLDLDHPEVIFVKRLDGTGYCFFYSTLAQFENAAYGFMGVLRAKIEDESKLKQEPPKNVDELCFKAALSAIELVFHPTWQDQEGYDGTRCVAASCIKEMKWEDTIPQVCIIEQIGDEIQIREGFEFLEHPGYPLALVIGSKPHGGGLCRFYDSFEEFKQEATKPPSQDKWLAQLIYRLYRKTPSIMTGLPTPPSQDGEGVGVECHAYTINRKGQLIERSRK